MSRRSSVHEIDCPKHDWLDDAAIAACEDCDEYGRIEVDTQDV